MEFLKLLSNTRCSALNTFFSAITYFGDETLFIVAGLIVFWCFSKNAGRYIITTGLIGTSINQCMKLIFKIPRPWVIDPSFQIVESARAGATGYSFPSGHTQNSVGTYLGLAITSKNKWVKGVCIALSLLVPFSRMYLGVHTPLDVGVAAACAVILVLVLLKPMTGITPAFHKSKDDKPRCSPKQIRICLIISVVMCCGYALFVSLCNFGSDIDSENLAHGVKNAWTLLGASLGLWLSFEIDERYINFSTKAPLWLQIVKVAAGLALAMGIKSGLKPLMNLISSSPWTNAVRYFALVMFAGALWPWIIEVIKKKTRSLQMGMGSMNG